MPKLEPFDVNAWATGLDFDFTGRQWGGTGSIKVKKRKPVKAKRTIKPAIAALASEFDSGGRSLPDHQAMVDWYGERYDSGVSLFTDAKIIDPKEATGIAKVRDDAPWTNNRGGANTDKEGLDLLMEAMRDQHVEDDD